MAPSRISERTRALAKALRQDQTKGEKALWRVLRELKAEGIRFRRQAPIGAYIVDCVVFSKKTIIEIDGDVHALGEQIAHDKRRDTWLRSQGF
ncbi:endonuclease domain-containing protein [Roseibium sp.]|uniref:endonuclease domain-containing protein n=1 Tax=Roseibium sp. TaxID=1936156 RepID=UPI003B511E3C